MSATAPASGQDPVHDPGQDPCLERRWAAGRAVDLRRTLAPLRRGTGDPAFRIVDGRLWRTQLTPEGPATLALWVVAGSAGAAPGSAGAASAGSAGAASGSEVLARAWGPGAQWSLDRLESLLGADDDWNSLDVSAYPGLVRVLRSHPGLRLPRTGLIMDALVPAVLEQRVTGVQARSAWRQLLLSYGAPAPGPAPAGMRVAPPPDVLLGVPAWRWSQWDVDLHRVRALRAAATVANRLQECVSMSPDDAMARLQLVPGVGIWTAAETAQRALGHPDAVSVNDYHVHNQVVYALTGRPRGSDEEMLELLAPWAGQRQRVVRLIEVAGITAPRFGPRQSLDRPRGS